MRLKISMQPISTRRSPRKGSRPVVSVSRTISRMNLPEPVISESGPPPRHLNNLGQNVLDPRAHGVETVGGIHHEIRTLALFGIGHLPRQDGIELFARHVVAGKNPFALNFGR